MRARAAPGLVLLFAVVALAHALWLGVVTDDAGIALACARTMVRGHGLRLTEWSARVEAFSDPLWVLWLAIPYLLGLAAPAFAHLTGALFAAAAVGVVGLVPSRAEGRPMRPLDALAPALLACDTTYAFWAGAGLETGAFALALSLTLLGLAGGGGWSALPAGAMGVLRPEGLLYALLLAPFWRAGSSPSASGVGGALSRASDKLRWALRAALPALAWLAFRRAYYGEWLPNTYYAKRSWDFGGPRYLRQWLADGAWHMALLLSPLALAVARTRRTAALALATCAAGAAFILFSGGDWMAEHRFVAHALPGVALAVGVLPLAIETVLPRMVAASAAAVILALAIAGARPRSLERKKDPILPLSYVAEQGRWFRAEADRLGIAHPRIAHFDIGGLALESGGEIIDLAGLADRYIGRVGLSAHRQICDYIFEAVRPDMLNIHGPSRPLRDDPRLLRDYRLAATGLWGENWVRRFASR